MNTIEVSAEDVPLPTQADRIIAFVDAALRLLNKTHHEVSILLCSDERIREMNSTYRNKDEATDVLSFSQDDSSDEANTAVGVTQELTKQGQIPQLLGDIVLALPYLRRQAEEYNVSFESEFKRMLIHGMLHLTGSHHDTEEQHRTMLERQEAILRELEQEYRF
ncbi:MAG: rRNA maturation RNase YbeY [Spirochaetaceae bacterium]|nr:MAG: rRNA maturation RNase YbeY [Spirochaetaceae bacterium]